MNLAERLRGVVRPASGDGPQGPSLQSARIGQQSAHTDRCRGGPSGPPPDAVAEILDGEWRESRGQRYLVIDRKYPTGHRHGHVAVADCVPAADDVWRRLHLLMPEASPWISPGGRLLFIDLETTGLAGGAGTYAFLVGCGWFEGAAFRVRQFVLTSYAAERGLLEEVAETAGAACALVTYNGKTFDVPLIETRFLFHRMETPFTGLPHIDMLHPARHLWRSPGAAGDSRADGEERRATCRLTDVEEAVLGHVREGDVPGFEIPSRYFQYVRSGDARPLDAVLEHNRLDLLALAMLTARAAWLLEEGAPGARTAREALGLGRLYERAGMVADARACFARAGGAGADLKVRPYTVRPYNVPPYNDVDPLTLAEALRAYAVLCRRERRYDEAAGAWRRILARRCPPHIAHEATQALAVHHEHRLRDLRAARQFAVQSLQFQVSLSRAQAVHHRLARLDRKLGGVPPDPASLF